MADLNAYDEVVLQDSSGNNVTVTNNRLNTNAITTSNVFDNITNEKQFFATSPGEITIVGASSYDIHLKTGSVKNIHLNDFTVNLNASSAIGIVKYELYETATISANGTAITRSNVNRQSVATSDATLFFTPTITNNGTKLMTYNIHQDWETYMAPSYTTPYKLILKTSTSYILRIINGYNQAIDLTWFLYWSEQ